MVAPDEGRPDGAYAFAVRPDAGLADEDSSDADSFMSDEDDDDARDFARVVEEAKLPPSERNHRDYEVKRMPCHFDGGRPLNVAVEFVLAARTAREEHAAKGRCDPELPPDFLAVFDVDIRELLVYLF